MKTKWKPVYKRDDDKHFILVQVSNNKIMEDRRGFIHVRSHNGKQMFTETINRSILDAMYNTDKYA